MPTATKPRRLLAQSMPRFVNTASPAAPFGARSLDWGLGVLFLLMRVGKGGKREKGGVSWSLRRGEERAREMGRPKHRDRRGGGERERHLTYRDARQAGTPPPACSVKKCWPRPRWPRTPGTCRRGSSARPGRRSRTRSRGGRRR